MCYSRLSKKVESPEILVAQKVELAFKQCGELCIGRRKQDLPFTGQDNLPQIVKETQRIQIIDVGDRVVDQDNGRRRPELRVLEAKFGADIEGPAGGL